MRTNSLKDLESDYGRYLPTGWRRNLLKFTRAMPPWGPTYRLALSFQRPFLKRQETPVDLETFGLKLRFHPHDNIAERRVLLTPARFDPLERSVLRSALTEGSCFVDIGANCGLYSFSLWSALGPSGKIIALEPQTRVADRLQFNIKTNGLSNIHLHRVAVSDREGEAVLHQNDDNLGEASLEEAHVKNKAHQERVPMRPLLSILAEEGVSSIDGLKIDIEGHEDSAMMPFLEQTEDSLLPKVIVTENSRKYWRKDWVAFAETRGYRITHDTRRNLVLERPRG